MRKIVFAALLAAVALPSFAAGAAPEKADPGYPKPRLSEAENQRRMRCGFDAALAESECSKLHEKAMNQMQERLDYERARWTPADRERAERATRDLTSGPGADEFDKLSKPDAKAGANHELGRRAEEETLNKLEAQKAAMTPEQRAAHKKAVADYFDGPDALELKDLQPKKAR